LAERPVDEHGELVDDLEDAEYLLYYGGDLYEGEDEGGSSSDDGSNTGDSSGSDSEDDNNNASEYDTAEESAPEPEPETEPEEPEDDSSNDDSSESDSEDDEDDDLCEHCGESSCPLGPAVVHHVVSSDDGFTAMLRHSLPDGTELRNVIYFECDGDDGVEYLASFRSPGRGCLHWTTMYNESHVEDVSGPQIVYARYNKEDGYVLRPDIVITLVECAGEDGTLEDDMFILVERPAGEYGVEAMPKNGWRVPGDTEERRCFEERLVFGAGDIEEEDWDGDDKLGQIQNSTIFRLKAKRLDIPLRRAMRQWLENRHNPRHPAGQAYIGGLYDSTMAEQEVTDAGTPSPPAAAAAAAPPYEDCPCDTGKPCYICYCDAKAGVCQCICAQCNSSHGTDWVGCEDCDRSWCNQCGRVTMAPQTSDSL